MPNKKSAAKELRKSIKRNAANKKASSQLKSLIKSNLKQLKGGDKKVKEDIVKTIKALDKAVKKGILKKNTAGRRKSLLMKKINVLK
ncbi:TPA: 30S ribosomal protein S20 [Candidatus Falkowbacteria bacterium]|jgi:small subunit ribosomal protein S20|nr:MAG: 30S ribosomal protein S20 [Candidatus Falkowbacteria bacterium GW2011_GWF2_43_32]HBA36809.1 30S ribosomal protein S20 [Candidatus Falkowbacteria bacterium]